MNIDRITITGADDLTSIKGNTKMNMVAITEEFPFVEWGILFSKAKEGTLRYPSQKWISLLNDYDLRLSAHFCGWYSKQILEEQNFKLMTNLAPNFKRVQLNYNFNNFNNWNLKELTEFMRDEERLSIILQYNKSNERAIKSLLENDISSNIHFLYDGSGGRGTVIKKFEKPFIGHYTGYSGGLNLLNLDSVMDSISEININANCFLDMESGARINNQFDLDNVFNILHKSEKKVKNNLVIQ